MILCACLLMREERRRRWLVLRLAIYSIEKEGIDKQTDRTDRRWAATTQGCPTAMQVMQVMQDSLKSTLRINGRPLY